MIREYADQKDAVVLARTRLGADARATLTRRLLWSGTDMMYGWMPTGTALLFATNRRGSRELWAVRVTDGKGAGAPQLVQPDINGVYEPLGITKNGSLMYMGIGVAGFANVAKVDWNTGSVSDIEDVSAGLIPDMGAAWSPDGRSLAFIAHRGSNLLQNRFIAVRSVETGETRELLPGDLTATRVKWFPDGNSFLVNGEYAVDAKTGNVRRFIPGALVLEWMPDGKSVVYETRDETKRANARLFQRDLESGTDREISVGAQAGARPLFIGFAVSPDGHIAFIPGYAPQNMVLSVLPPNGGPPRQVLNGDGVGVVAWTGDSRRIVYSKGNEFWSVPAEGGESIRLQLPNSAIGNRSLSIHPNGQQILYTGSAQQREVWIMENLIPAVEKALRSAR